MTNEKAIKELQDWKMYSNHNYPVAAVDMAIEALETLTPKKPKYTLGFMCPKCDSYLIGRSFCPCCGQAIDWGKDYEDEM